MENLHLKLVVEKKLKREIQILYLLAEQDQSISGKEIALRLNISLSTVLTDLENLKKTIPKNWEIGFKKNIGYTLKIGKGINMPNYVKEILLSSPLFEIGIGIFNNELLSPHDWEEKIFVSESTLKRHLTVFKSILKEYKLKLVMNPINIVGNEADIRIFYFEFFYSSNKIPQFDSLKENEHEFFIKLESFISLDHLQYYRWMHWAIIIIRRVSFGNEIVINEELLSIINSKMDKNTVMKIKELYFELFKQNLALKEIAFLYLIRWDTLILNEHEKVVEIEITNERSKKLAKNFILKKVKELSIDSYAHPHVYFYFESFFTHVMVMSGITPIFQKNSDDINHFAQSKHPKIFSFWIEALVENKEIFKNISTVLYEDLAAQLTMLTCPYLVKLNQSPKHIVFILDTTVINLNYLTALAERYILNNVQVSVISNVLLTDDIINNINADLIVSNIGIESSRRIFYISDLPTESEWHAINSKIFGMNTFD
ncbi:helix-turn-helix domain-containing protein [Carnobacterium maltaromaticum]|uniref:helix-turn-helix domain-containing protein n=1 Tax=Carnobacterium maltaromaticum TaxID=2751 RepID=UPI0012F85A50|nr:helix-turn-helix domain-containing protein [Carnobacterium maltaromaticum]